ncbi:hypothetical protein [Kytococcus sp. Marseille-QA3725]
MTPETTDPDELAARLERWDASGGHLHVAHRTDETVTVHLLTCDGGKVMEVLQGPPTAAVERALEQAD